MTVSRRLVPGQVHAATRRTANRCRFLNPRDGVRELLGYCLGRALELSPGVRLHAYSVNTTHPHVVATDAPGEGRPSALPRFFQLLHSLVARSMNARLGRGGAFFCAGSYDNVELHGERTREEQLLYAWTNVTKDGLVASVDDWPGLQFLPEDLGTTVVFTKPKGGFFGGRRPAGGVVPTDPSALEEWRAKLRKEELVALAKLRRDDDRRERSDKRRRQLARERRWRRKRKEAAPKPRSRSTLPETVTVTIHVPPGYEGWPVEEVRTHFRRLVDEHEATIGAARKTAGFTRVKGVAAILAEDPREGATDNWPTFARNPRIACKDRRTRVQVLRGLRPGGPRSARSASGGDAASGRSSSRAGRTGSACSTAPASRVSCARARSRAARPARRLTLPDGARRSRRQVLATRLGPGRLHVRTDRPARVLGLRLRRGAAVWPARSATTQGRVTSTSWLPRTEPPPAGDEQQVLCTRDHPFWSATRERWVDADALVEGERLVDSTGNALWVKRVAFWSQAAHTYNFEVVDWHSYFVEESRDDAGIWVHNGPNVREGVLHIHDIFEPGSYQSRQLRRFVAAWNAEIANTDEGYMERGKRSKQQQKESDSWRREVRKEARFQEISPASGTVMRVGHLPDAAANIDGPHAGGKAMALDQRVNSVIGGAVGNMEIGDRYHSVKVDRDSAKAQDVLRGCGK